MRTVTLTLPRFGFIVATRAALGAGIGALLTTRLSDRQRWALGLGLIGFGAATTVPAARWLSAGVRRRGEPVEADPRLVGATRFPRKGDDIS